MLVSGRHFFPDVAPAALGHKALAVNLSDLAAMGARPLGFTLALALPEVDDAWLGELARGLFALADAHACPLVGGDTTRGPLNLCITVFGEVRPGQSLRRSAAQVGDDIYVSGDLGGAALALAVLAGSSGAPIQGWTTTPGPVCGIAWSAPRPGWRWARPWWVWRTRPSTSATALPVTWAMCCAPAASGPSCCWRPCPSQTRWPLCQRHSGCAVCCRAATTTSWCSPRQPAPALRWKRQRGSATRPVRRVGQIVTGSGLHLVDGQGTRQSFAGAGFDHFP